MDSTLTPIAFAGACVLVAGAILGTYALVLRDRLAEPLWFAATVGAAMVVVGGFASADVAQLTLRNSPMLLATAAMWLVARRHLRAAATGAASPGLPRWQAAAWASFLPMAATAGAALVLLPMLGLKAAAEVPWLQLQCRTMAEVGLVDPAWRICALARDISAYWWVYAMIGAGIGSAVLTLWLVLRAAPRGARWRLLGFVVLVFLVQSAADALGDGEADSIGDAPWQAMALWVVVIALAAFAAFRPLRPTPAPAVDAVPPRPRRWPRRVALAACATAGVFAVAVAAYVAHLQSQLRASEPYASAVARARVHPEVIARLGSPVEAEAAVAGVIRDDFPGVDGAVSAISIPLRGPRGRAHLWTRAMTIDGDWRLIELALDDDAIRRRERVDLFDAAERAAEDARRAAR